MQDLFKNINPKIVLIVLLSFLVGWQLGHRDLQIKLTNYQPTVSVVNKEPPKQIKVDFKLFWDTWDLVSRTYFDKKSIDPNKLFYGAISGMVAALEDPYTVFLPPEQQKFSKEELNGSFEGVGIQLGFNKEKRLVVVAPLAGTPAQRAGIKPEDIIVKIGDKDTTNMTLPEAVNLIRGIKGTQITLTIFREGESDTRLFTLTRDIIIVKSVEVSYKETNTGKNVAVIKLSRFGERTNDEWNEAVADLLSKDSNAVILDLRNNPGGFLEGAVFIGSEFLEDGNVVLQENSEGVRTSFKVSRAGKLTNIPLVTLINKGSASASEIVAGALQDRKRSTLVGEKSFGKGTIQEAQDLEKGAGIHITVAKWLTPNGRWVNDTQGLEPDVTIENDKQSLPSDEGKEDAAKDAQFDKALELLN
ncbi:S41 family peptidase [Candidatus Daviesbacteria bacterium]|nr:S41 family peptidase [Candidatus Daviesbacteria bacterium]